MANKAICALTYGDTHVFTLPYGECSTAAATAAKTVAVQGGKFSLETGARVAVKFTVTNTASSPTLNVSGTGAKAIMYRGSAISAGYLAANRVYDFIYDGTDWELIGDIDTNTANSTGTTNKTGTKLFLAGATSQAASPTTYSNSGVYIGTDNCLYSNGEKVMTGSSDIPGNRVGDIVITARNDIPSNYLLCDGSSVASSQTELLNALPPIDGTKYTDWEANKEVSINLGNGLFYNNKYYFPERSSTSIRINRCSELVTVDKTINVATVSTAYAEICDFQYLNGYFILLYFDNSRLYIAYTTNIEGSWSVYTYGTTATSDSKIVYSNSLYWIITRYDKKIYYAYSTSIAGTYTSSYISISYNITNFALAYTDKAIALHGSYSGYNNGCGVKINTVAKTAIAIDKTASQFYSRSSIAYTDGTYLYFGYHNWNGDYFKIMKYAYDGTTAIETYEIDDEESPLPINYDTLTAWYYNGYFYLFSPYSGKILKSSSWKFDTIVKTFQIIASGSLTDSHYFQGCYFINNKDEIFVSTRSAHFESSGANSYYCKMVATLPNISFINAKAYIKASS